MKTSTEGTELTMTIGFTKLFTAFVAVTLVCPTQLIAADSAPARVHDIQLNKLAAMTGAIVTPEGRPVADEKIQLFSASQLIAQIKTDNQGRFSVKGLRPGIHVIRSRFGIQACRFWTFSTAPPAARKGLVVTTGNVVRGQICGEDICGEECGGCGEGCCEASGGCPLLNGSMTTGTLLAAGGFAAITATTIAVSTRSSSSDATGAGNGGLGAGGNNPGAASP